MENLPDDEGLQEEFEGDYLVWEVWSVSPRGYRPVCKRIFPHPQWQFAEKLAARLRDRGHEDVEVILGTTEDLP